MTAERAVRISVASFSIRENTGEIQRCVFELQSDPDSDESVVHQNQRLADLSEWLSEVSIFYFVCVAC